jgi:hypothetical protein
MAGVHDMKITTLSLPLLLALSGVLSLFAAPSARATSIVEPSVITFLDAGSNRHIYLFVMGSNNHLVSRHFDGTSWTSHDHGLPPGSTRAYTPKAVTYVDDTGRRRIYVFAIDQDGRLMLLFHKGAGFSWQWSLQGGPVLNQPSLSATTFLDDNGVRRIYAFAHNLPNDGPVFAPLVTNFWDGNNWNWVQMNNALADPQSSGSFSLVTNYIGNDGRRRMDVFTTDAPDRAVLRHSWTSGAWTVANLHGQAWISGSVVNFLDTAGNRQVHLFAFNPFWESIWDRHGGVWDNIGGPPPPLSAFDSMSAIAFKDPSGFPAMHLYVVVAGRLYLRTWVNNAWQSWTNFGQPGNPPDLYIKDAVAITYVDSRSSDQHIWVFVKGDHLYAKRWNGSSWQWTDLGEY